MATLSQAKAPSNGGTIIQITAPELPDGFYYVYVGDNETQMKSLDFDNGKQCQLQVGSAKFVTIPMALGGPYNVTLRLARGDTPQADVTIPFSLEIIPFDLKSGIYSYRRKMAPKMATGPRTLAREPFPQEG